VHVTVPPVGLPSWVQEKRLVVAVETKITPAGRVSTTLTFEVFAVPRLLMVRV
jgi:hypothetical protein